MFVQSLMVARAKEELEQEIVVKEEEKETYLAERAPPLNIHSLSLAQLQVSSLYPPHYFVPLPLTIKHNISRSGNSLK